ncbi:uncharacterized protein TRAVEDRAFT_43084 [Trametes versicolor FP-101664 SS1]|uniref:uncharacterized protein n=1 Tax=Trametes versicolor (strain FP-101664) TaxID=717944 RepID=UPI000462494A|nr:uncharacterized protein TRAVEDRAFT_43084 [Trametes versicolor FP-101664 SS1]EIW62752.1 hypothetical protein TRAVEDRAFT_43084 [Trametes versicolor FP-101664 SS1]
MSSPRKLSVHPASLMLPEDIFAPAPTMAHSDNANGASAVTPTEEDAPAAELSGFSDGNAALLLNSDDTATSALPTLSCTKLVWHMGLPEQSRDQRPT